MQTNNHPLIAQSSGPHHFMRVRDMFRALAAHRAVLGARYRSWEQEATQPMIQGLLGLLAGSEEALALGLSRLADGDDSALDTWVQFSADLSLVDEPDLDCPHAILTAASKADDSLRNLWRPLRSAAGSERLRDLLDGIDDQLIARGRARSRWLALAS